MYNLSIPHLSIKGASSVVQVMEFRRRRKYLNISCVYPSMSDLLSIHLFNENELF